MTVPICPHWISANRGNLGTRTDAQIFAEWQPEFVKIICNDIKVPYLEDVPTNSKIIIRHMPEIESVIPKNILGRSCMQTLH